MGYCCGVHLQKKIDSIVVDYTVPAEVTKLHPVTGAGTLRPCDFCLSPAEYLVSINLNPINWTPHLKEIDEYVPLPTNYIGDIIPDPNTVTCGADTVKYYDPNEPSGSIADLT